MCSTPAICSSFTLLALGQPTYEAAAHIDFAEIEGFQVLVIIDVHSKWIEATPLHSATVTTTSERLQLSSQIMVYQKKL